MTILSRVFSSGLLPSITKPTRVTNISATLIDNLYINFNVADRAISGILNTDISDHLPLFMLINSDNPVGTRRNLSFTSRKLDNNKLCAFKNKLVEADWEWPEWTETWPKILPPW